MKKFVGLQCSTPSKKPPLPRPNPPYSHVYVTIRRIGYSGTFDLKLIHYISARSSAAHTVMWQLILHLHFTFPYLGRKTLIVHCCSLAQVYYTILHPYMWVFFIGPASPSSKNPSFKKTYKFYFAYLYDKSRFFETLMIDFNIFKCIILIQGTQVGYTLK